MSNKDHPEYSVWKNIRRRCKDPTNISFKRYGGRGIKVCKRWESFANFLLDMGPRPSPSHTIERKNNDGDYTNNNCRWATQQEQSRNRRGNRYVRFGGNRMILAEAVEKTGMSHSTFLGRMRLGWTEEKALSTPIRQHGELSKQDIKKIESDQRTLRVIAAHYGIGTTTVWRIKHGQKVRGK